jgi:CHAT domain-containing protein
VIDLSLASGWRRLVLLLALSTLACNKETAIRQPAPPPPSGRLRETLPRLTGFDSWRECKSRDGGSVERADCGAANIPAHLVSIGVGECDRAMKTEADVVEVLAYVPHCTDAAVERLASIAAPRNRATTMSDLAAAYYVRAQRKDQPSDLVRSLDASGEALRLSPDSAAARFNHVLALEALGFTDDAIAIWNGLRNERERGWATEAGQHWAQLTKEQTVSAAIQWPQNIERLPLVAQAGDHKAVEMLVSPYRAAAQRHIEDVVLPAWAQAVAEGRDDVANEQLVLAAMVASALARLTKDRFLLDCVGRIRASPQSALLREGHLAFRKARLAQQAFDSEGAAEIYADAARALAASGSPLHITATIGRAPGLTLNGKFDQTLELLRAVEEDARRYPNLMARVHTSRGFVYMVQGRNTDAIAQYGKAQAIFASMGDREGLGNAHLRRAGLFRNVGAEDLTWAEAFQALRNAGAISDFQTRHALLGECASSATALGYATAGLRYQDAAVQLLRDQLSGSENADEPRLEQMRLNLGIALRARASIRAKTKDVAGARADLDEAVPLIYTPMRKDEQARVSGLRARFAEAEAQTVGAKDRKKAIALLSEAIDHATQTRYLTLIASLFTQRAELHRLEGDKPAAVGDLARAVDALRDEEQLMLRGETADTERFWSAYFARYQEAYRQLIGLLIEKGADVEAFAYSEKARAYEPLHRVMQRDDVPEAFQKAIRGGEPMGLHEIRRLLPAGTFLLQYTVLDERTYVWLVWKDDYVQRTLPIGNAAIAQWTAALQRMAETRERTGWDAALSAPYKALLADPVARIAKLHLGEGPARVIIVPDRAMHGLPFAALSDGKRSLIQDYLVSVAASATLYAFSLEQDRQLAHRKPASVLIVADPAFDRNLPVAAGLPELRTARTEAANIARIYRPVAHVPPPLMQKDATVPAFLRLAADSSIIHIASHGVANPTVPSQSFLLLAPTESGDSGVLDAERLIAQLRLDRTRLVVLSACSTAGGTRIGPEGLAPLVRPLVAAGVAGVVGTLWKVDDNAATAEVLVKFHQHYRDGADADVALRLAQLEMLRDSDLGRNSPRVWAPFQMIGHASSPFASRSHN